MTNRRTTAAGSPTDTELRLRAILETAVDGIITIDERGIIDSFNPSAERLFGLSADEAIGENVSILMPPPYCDEHDGYMANYLRTGEAKIIGRGREVEGRRADGSTFPMHLSISEVPLEGGRLFTGIVRDTTDLVESRRELRRQRDFAESLIDTAHAIVLVLDPEGCVVRFNRYFEELSGYDAEETHGVDWFEHFLPERERARICGVFHEVLDGGDVYGSVNAIETRSGEEREIAWWGRALYDEDGRTTGVLSVGHDVTELNRVRERLVQSERLSAIGEAMTGLTHESRNALARSHANLRMLTRRLRDRPELLELIDRSLAAQDDVQRLFDEVRQYAAPIVLRREPTDLAQLVRETWDELATLRTGRDAELTLDVDEPDVEIEVDRFAIRGVVRNLLENALAACRDPVRIRVGISTHDTPPTHAIRLAVRDNGPGVPAAARSRLFDAFFTTKTHGTGLGLSIVKRIVEEHGGELALAEGGRGAEFHVTLPRERT